MGKRSPVLGYNHNFKHRGLIFHVQTEDSGVGNPHLFTHLFHGGVIISSRRMDYDADAEVAVVKGLMQSQHKVVLKDLKTGNLDDKIDSYLGNNPDLLPRKSGTATPTPPPDLAIPETIARSDSERAHTEVDSDQASEIAAAEAARISGAQAARQAEEQAQAARAEAARLAEAAAVEAAIMESTAQAEAAKAAAQAAIDKATAEAAAARELQAMADAEVARAKELQQQAAAANAHARELEQQLGQSRMPVAPSNAHSGAISLSSGLSAATVRTDSVPGRALNLDVADPKRHRLPTAVEMPAVADPTLGDPVVTFSSGAARPVSQSEGIPQAIPEHPDRSGAYSMRRVAKRPSSAAPPAQRRTPAPRTPEPRPRAPEHFQNHRPAGKSANSEPGRRSSVVVSRPAVIIGAPPKMVGKNRTPGARKVRRSFGKDQVSEKSLDEVIMAYLSEDRSD